MIFVSANNGSSAINSTIGGLGIKLPVAIATQDAGQIESETVDVIVVNPVSQTMKNHLANNRMIAVDRVAAATVVTVMLAFAQDVVDLVFQSFERQRRTIFVAFAGVIEHDVQDHFDAGAVQRLDHLLELAHLCTRLLVSARNRDEAKRKPSDRSPNSWAVLISVRRCL